MTELPPKCLATLRRMLQAGPITRLYTGGGNPKFGIASHEGFALRMPAADLSDWQTLNDKGELQDIPRQAHALRVWDAASRTYLPISPTMKGAPTTAEATDAWFVDVVKKLKGSPYIGSALLDRLVSSKRTSSLEKMMGGALDEAFDGTFCNRWTKIVLDTVVTAEIS